MFVDQFKLNFNFSVYFTHLSILSNPLYDKFSCLSQSLDLPFGKSLFEKLETSISVSRNLEILMIVIAI